MATATSSLPRGQLPRTIDAASLEGSSVQDRPQGRSFGSTVGACSGHFNHHSYLNRPFYATAPAVHKRRSRSVAELLGILPTEQLAVDLLIDTYFDRVHWFLLVFFQEPFRERYRALISQRELWAGNTNEDFSFACTVLAVIALGLQYTCSYRKQRLVLLGVQPEALLESLLSTIQTVLFDLIAIGSLESVQVCILIGSYYLFHGCPGPALPAIGCGLRVAQGMGLHRTQHEPVSSTGECRRAEAKRCWMALFEIDRFCSMVYGLPISFANDDCDIEQLVLSPLPLRASNNQAVSNPLRNSTLLLYKWHMSNFSMILTDILRDLYGPGPRPNGENCGPASLHGSSVQILWRKINTLDKKLRSWYDNVPPVLRMEDADSKQRAYASPEAMAMDIGGSGEVFEGHVLRMQALTLKLAFENAIIVTHRPLLSLRSEKAFPFDSGQAEPGAGRQNPYGASIEACRIAALNIATIGSYPSFDEARETYAASFIGIHIFTAGIVLCLIASYEPMTSQAHEAKVGIRKLMAMQRQLQNKSVIANQGLQILEKIVCLVIERELQEVLSCERPKTLTSPSSNDDMRISGRERNNTYQTNSLDTPGIGPHMDKDNQSAKSDAVTPGVALTNVEPDTSHPPISQPQLSIDAGM